MSILRLVLLAVGLAALFSSAQWVGSGYEFEVEEPKVDLARVPNALGDWEGEKTEDVDETVLRVMNCHSHSNRIYQDSAGRVVLAHAAIWTNQQDVWSVAPHHPEMCYTGGGWEILQRDRMQVPVDEREVTMELIHFQKNGESVVTAHCFRFGEDYVVNSSEGRSLHFKLRAAETWPPTVKVLLQMSASSISTAREPLKEFAELMLEDIEQQIRSDAEPTVLADGAAEPDSEMVLQGDS